jgi:serine protease Do
MMDLQSQVSNRLLRASLVVLILAGPLAGTVSCAAPPGYAALVHTAAPSVVTVLVEQERVGAGDRAAARAATRAAADADPNAVSAIVRRLLAAPSGGAGRDDGPGGSLGSGFVVREDGLIVTNRHVIVDARTVKVRLSDGREFAAKILGEDAVTDIALLSIQAGRLPALRLGSTNAVSVGDIVIAIGNPYGLGQSVSAGIVSARGRIIEDDPYIDFLQTDAAINRGNSGGPLMTTDGVVVGVTSAIFSPSGGSVGIGFAIPAETVSAIVREIEAHGHVERGYLGISAQPMTSLMAAALHLKSAEGALVTSVEAQGPADGGLVIGDVLLKIESTPVSFKDLSKLSARLVPGSLATLNLVRSGAPLSIAIKVGRLPEPPSDPTLSGAQDVWVPGLRIGVAETSTAIRKAIKADEESSGMIVTQLRPAGAGALAGLRVGDLITHIGTQQLYVAADLASVKAPTPQEPLLLRVVREGSPGFVALTGEPAP